MEYKNILIIKMSSLGDVLHTLPFASSLRERFPKAKISWLVHPQFSGFVPEKPIIDEVIYFDKAAFKKLGLLEKLKFIYNFRKELHSKHFDLVIDMQGLFKSALVAALTGTKEKIGYCEMREGSGFISKAICGVHSKEHVIERYLDVARYLGATIKEIKFPMPNLIEEQRSVTTKLAAAVRNIPRYVVFVVGARWESKEWSPSNFAKLADKVCADGSYVVLAGGPDEVKKGEQVISEANTDQIINLIGKTSLRELASLIDGAKIFVSGDTGPLHVAAALKKPLIALYGPTLADRTGPYGSENSTVIISPASDAGCLKKKIAETKSMEAITVEMVFEAYEQKLKDIKEAKEPIERKSITRSTKKRNKWHKK